MTRATLYLRLPASPSTCIESRVIKVVAGHAALGVTTYIAQLINAGRGVFC